MEIDIRHPEDWPDNRSNFIGQLEIDAKKDLLWRLGHKPATNPLRYDPSKEPRPNPSPPPKPAACHVHARNGDTRPVEPIRIPLPPAPPGTLLLYANTNLERRFIRMPQDVNPNPQPGEPPSIPVLTADFDLQTADDYELCCFLWLKLPDERFTLGTFQDYCRSTHGIGLQKARRLHHYLETCGSLVLQQENRPRRRPIRWYWRAARPPTRLPDQDEADDIDADGLE